MFRVTDMDRGLARDLDSDMNRERKMGRARIGTRTGTHTSTGKGTRTGTETGTETGLGTGTGTGTISMLDYSTKKEPTVDNRDRISFIVLLKLAQNCLFEKILKICH